MSSDGYGLIIRMNLASIINSVFRRQSEISENRPAWQQSHRRMYLLEGLNKSDFSDYYNIIYGHNMNDGSMFGSLKNIRMTVSGKRINTSLYILRQPPTVIESSLMRMQSMAVMYTK